MGALDATYQPELPLAEYSKEEVYDIITKHLNPKKTPGYDLITGKVLRELPEIGILYLTKLYNAIQRCGFYPQWKVAVIIIIQKPGKPPEDVKSYRTISLLPVISKVFEKLLLLRLLPVIDKYNLIPTHQFGFRHKHSTLVQAHRIVAEINRTFEDKKYCSAIFLDVSQAFDKVWHTGLFYKLKTKLPSNLYAILKSYLEYRHYLVKQQNARSDLLPIRSGVPQGSVLGPVLYFHR